MIGHVLINANEVISNDYTYNHDALDLVGAEKSVSDVVALEDGIVELVISDVKGTDRNTKGTATYGNFVKIKHKNGQKTLYAHMKYGSVKVKEGEIITKGEKLGTMGSTGNAYGVHLHFEVRNSDESRENPYEYLWGQKEIENPVIAPLEISKPKDPVKEELIETPKEIVKEIKKPKIKDTLKEESKKEASLKENPPSYLENSEYYWGSIVDALKEINVDSSYKNRAKLAMKNNIFNYKGTASQNLHMLKLLKKGKLISV